VQPAAVLGGDVGQLAPDPRLATEADVAQAVTEGGLHQVGTVAAIEDGRDGDTGKRPPALSTTALTSRRRPRPRRTGADEGQRHAQSSGGLHCGSGLLQGEDGDRSNPPA